MLRSTMRPWLVPAVVLTGLAVGGLAVGGRTACPAPPAPVALAWTLARSDVAIYDVAPVQFAADREVLGTTTVRTVYGHELHDGQYLPVSARADELFAILALHLPTGLSSAPSPQTRRIDLGDAADVVAKGTASATVRADGRVDIPFTWGFQARGELDKDVRLVVDEGKADGTRTFDPSRGVVTSARIRVSARKRTSVGGKAEPAGRLDGTFDLRLREVRVARYPGFHAEVNAAIDAGVKTIKGWQKPEGSYPAFAEHDLGTTALCVLTLAACGVPREDPAVAKGLQWIVSRNPPPRTYARALALMAFDEAFTPPGEEALLAAGRAKARRRALSAEQRAWCERVSGHLERDMESPGSWGYPSAANAVLKFDSSNTQYGALGLRAASRLGFPVKDTTWFGLTRHFEVVRERKGPRATLALLREGDPAPPVAGGTSAAPPTVTVPEVTGFLYSTRETRPWLSMVCAGIASLELARHELVTAKSPKATSTFVDEVEARVLSGWAWLDAHWAVDRNAEHPGLTWPYYALYALERAAIFSRVRTVGGRDWYFEGAVQILLRRHKDGHWDEAGTDKTIGTCFALLFLKRATVPLAVTTDGR
jgi:hypothetical protein